MTRARQLSSFLVVLATISITACGGGGGVMPPPNASVSISPRHAALVATAQTQQFTATVTGVTDLSVTWGVDGTAGGSAAAGTISASGLYTPPATPGSHTVTATSVAMSTASASASVGVTDLAGVFTYHNDLARDGVNSQEYALTPANVKSTMFGKLTSCAVDGAVYTQPLWVPGVSIGGGIHNVVYVATQHDSLYAFDADASPCVKYWQVNLLDTLHGGTSGENAVVWNEVGYCYGDVYPEVGVTGTPVIDPATNTIYLVSASEVGGAGGGGCSGFSGTFYHRLHALDLSTGSETFNAPVSIAASVPGTGDGASGGMVSFNSQLHHNRSGLALSGSVVYVPFAAHEDATPYHGWLIGYNALNVQVQHSVFNTTPNGLNGADGGIWGGGGAPAVDGVGDIYVATGNGAFDQASSLSLENDYGDSVLRLSAFPATTANGMNLSVVDYFTPDSQACLAGSDADLGSGAPVLLPDQVSSVLPTHLLVQLGKDGVVYLVDRENMGQIHVNDCNVANSQIVQSFSATCCYWGTPAFWQNNLYFAGPGDVLKQFSFDPNAGFNTTAASQSNQAYGFPDPTPSVSSQGASNGIVWVIDAGLYGYASPNAAGGINCYVAPPPAACSGPAVLHAYDATNLGTELWNSQQAAANRDQAGAAVKFVPPTIANGKVYVSTRTEVDFYGLLP